MLNSQINHFTSAKFPKDPGHVWIHSRIPAVVDAIQDTRETQGGRFGRNKVLCNVWLNPKYKGGHVFWVNDLQQFFLTTCMYSIYRIYMHLLYQTCVKFDPTLYKMQPLHWILRFSADGFYRWHLKIEATGRSLDFLWIVGRHREDSVCTLECFPWIGTKIRQSWNGIFSRKI